MDILDKYINDTIFCGIMDYITWGEMKDQEIEYDYIWKIQSYKYCMNENFRQWFDYFWNGSYFLTFQKIINNMVLCTSTNMHDSIPAIMWSDRDFVILTIKTHGYNIRFANPILKRDKLVALTSVKSWGGALEFVDQTLQNDYDVVLAAVDQWGMAIRFADPTLQSDKTIVLTAVQNWGDAIRYAGDSLKHDPDIIAARCSCSYYSL